MHLELVSYAKNDSPQGHVMGTVRVVDGTLSIDESIPEDIKATIVGERAHTKVSHEAFLLKLERTFSGSYVRARLVR